MTPVSLAQLVDAFVNFPRTHSLSASALSRLAFWRAALGARPVGEISADEVDAALVQLQQRGRLRPTRGGKSIATGQPLKPSTMNRYMASLGELFKHARRLRIIHRTHTSPLAGLERAPEPVDPSRFVSVGEFEKLLRAAQVVDLRWGKLPALIRLAFTTGIRKGNLLALRWRDVNMDARTLTVGRTKNGAPHVAPLTDAVLHDLRALPRPLSPDELVFAARDGRAHGFRKLWLRTCAEAGLPGKTFHMLRHGCATALARGNISQANIMSVLGHKTLSASARYLHHSVEDRRTVIERVFT